MAENMSRTNSVRRIASSPDTESVPAQCKPHVARRTRTRQRIGHLAYTIEKSERTRLLTKVAEIAVILALIVSILPLFWPSGKLSTEFCYVLDSEGQPMKGAKEVGNELGPMSPISEWGRFEVLSSWHSGSHVYIFGSPNADGIRSIIGEGTLTREGDEWAPIRIKVVSRSKP